MNVLPECFSCFAVVKRARVRESRDGRDGGWGESMCACETKRGAEREGEKGGGGGACAWCVCVLV